MWNLEKVNFAIIISLFITKIYIKNDYEYLNSYFLYIMNYLDIINETEEFVKNYMKSYDESHDYNHIIRVKKLALKIAKKEKLDELSKFKVIIASLCHDIGDNKYTSDNNEQRRILTNFFKDKLNDEMIEEIIYITTYTSLSKEMANYNKIDDNNKILKCVQDSDRIDSLGSIGISRYFIYGIRKRNSNLNEIINNIKNRTKLIKKHIKTDYGKKLAKRKYKIIKKFLKDYYD